ncbi:cilia- and flagella-associated protein 47 [Holotrichia oblita]|uniref:Cilia- and flagella-associated protein 47 n=1 Tax=Holotrichia oblita TaxID=644536 RepID=A0ACB9TC49_HOLOL|nr:cilia- and flagella-associated protein 47 [Holotrichia oblita]
MTEFSFTILATLGAAKPIMVSFGTNEGPIIPRPTTTTLPPQIDANPAPVFERPEDVPNPSIYKPLVPHQYRTRILSRKPHPNLILGTPLDIKYTANLNKYNHKKRQLKSLGIGYRGPQVFEKQDYEYDLEKQRSLSLAPQAAESVPILKRLQNIRTGISRYYVPQIYDYSGEDDNSVYDRDDRKYYHQNKNYY